MDVLMGMKYADGTIIATSKSISIGLTVLKDTDDKTRILNKGCLMAFTGEAGDTINFAEYIQANIQLHSLRENGDEMSGKEVASYVRNNLATSIRSRNPYNVNVLIGSYDVEQQKPFLAWIDYLGTYADLDYGSHGYSSFYFTSLMDKHYKIGMSLEESLKLIKLCSDELEKRLPLDFKGLYINVIDKDGIRKI